MPTVLITGSSRGIGQCVALFLARQGYHVFASMRNLETGAQPLLDVAQQEQLKLDVVQLDVTDADSSMRAVEEVKQKAGQIDVLINNAGIGGYEGSFEEMSEEDLRAVFETNFFGVSRLIRLVLPDMRRRRSGTIVNVSSVGGRVAQACMSAFSASKFALEAMSEVLAQEVRRFDVRVAVIEPGVIGVPVEAEEDWAPDSSSPYEEFTRRLIRIYAKELEDPTPPEEVAKVIQHAIETDQPKLRYVVGEDAEAWIKTRQRLTDEAWTDWGQEMTDDAFADFYRTQVGREI